MTTSMRLLPRLSITVLLVSFMPTLALGGDESFDSVVKHIKSNYHAKQQGFFGAMVLARMAVKIIKPAGVKNFKMTLLRDLDYSESPGPQNGQFHSFIRTKIDPTWTPLVQYSSPREKQWTYVFVSREKEDVKILVVTLQQQDAVVLQTKFSPARLIEFMNNPQIMGISLNNENKAKENSVKTDDVENDEDVNVDKPKPPPSKPPNDRF